MAEEEERLLAFFSGAKYLEIFWFLELRELTVAAFRLEEGCVLEVLVFYEAKVLYQYTTKPATLPPDKLPFPSAWLRQQAASGGTPLVSADGKPGASVTSLAA